MPGKITRGLIIPKQAEMQKNYARYEVTRPEKEQSYAIMSQS